MRNTPEELENIKQDAHDFNAKVSVAVHYCPDACKALFAEAWKKAYRWAGDESLVRKELDRVTESLKVNAAAGFVPEFEDKLFVDLANLRRAAEEQEAAFLKRADDILGGLDNPPA